jgi:hypothetical protein
LQVESGNLIVRGCEFQENKPQVSLGLAVRRAVVSENIIKGKLNVANQSTGNVILKDNASDDAKPETKKD